MEISSISKRAKEAEWRNTVNPGTRVSKRPVHLHKVIPERLLREAEIHTSSRKDFSLVVSMSLSFYHVKSISERTGTRVLVSCQPRRLRRLKLS